MTEAVSLVENHRRYCLLMWQAHADAGDRGLALAFLGKQRDIAGTDLPSDFPHRDALIAANYRATEDLDGADVAELVKRVPLLTTQAEAVLAAFEAL